MTGIQKVTLFLIKIVLFPSLCNLQVIDTKIKPSLKDLVDLHSYFHSKVKILTFNIDFSTVKRPAECSLIFQDTRLQSTKHQSVTTMNGNKHKTKNASAFRNELAIPALPALLF